jgi:hypothetical protein
MLNYLLAPQLVGLDQISPPPVVPSMVLPHNIIHDLKGMVSGFQHKLQTIPTSCVEG